MRISQPKSCIPSDLCILAMEDLLCINHGDFVLWECCYYVAANDNQDTISLSKDASGVPSSS